MMIEVALRSSEKPVSLKDVSDSQDLPLKYLEQLTRQLVHAGLVSSVRGKYGGYTLAKPASQISVGDIVRAAEGDVAPVNCLEGDADKCPRADICPTLDFWRGLNQVINAYIDSYTLEQLAASDVCKVDA